MLHASPTVHERSMLAAFDAHLAWVETDLRGGILRHSALFEQTVLVGQATLVGLQLTDLLQPTGMATLWAQIEHSMHAGQHWQGQLAFSSGDTVIWLQLCWVPVMGFDSLPTHFLGFGMNITPMQEQIALLTEALNDAQRALLQHT